MTARLQFILFDQNGISKRYSFVFQALHLRKSLLEGFHKLHSMGFVVCKVLKPYFSPNHLQFIIFSKTDNWRLNMLSLVGCLAESENLCYYFWPLALPKHRKTYNSKIVVKPFAWTASPESLCVQPTWSGAWPFSWVKGPVQVADLLASFWLSSAASRQVLPL